MNIKTIIIDRILEEIQNQIRSATQGREDALEESRAHKGAMESRYDTFKEEAQYLANAHEAQLAELTGATNMLKSLRDNPPEITRGSLYAIIEAEDLDTGSSEKYFVLPAGGGNTYELAGDKIITINVMAPLARAFIGALEGDNVEFKTPQRKRRFSILSIT